jgi:hypothetical protein
MPLIQQGIQDARHYYRQILSFGWKIIDNLENESENEILMSLIMPVRKNNLSGWPPNAAWSGYLSATL